MPRPVRPPLKPAGVEVVILAGGLARRMGRDKSRLRLGRRTLLGHVRAAAVATGWRVRVIRRDAVPRCGPLGGLLTALLRPRAPLLVFLACDMPWITAATLRRVVARARRAGGAAFSVAPGESPGFPLVLPARDREAVGEQIGRGEFSLHQLARRLQAARVTPRRADELANVNTPEDWEDARRRFRGPAA